MISDWEGLDRLSKPDPHGSNYRASICTAVNAGIDMVELKIKSPESLALDYII